MCRQPVLDQIACPDAEHHIALQMRFPCDHVTDHVGPNHLFVNGVGLDMFAVEADARFGRAHSLQRLHQPARTGRRGDLGRREMPYRRAAELAVQPEQRHQVHHGQGVGRDVVEVAQIRRVQAGGVQQVGEQLLMHLRAPRPPPYSSNSTATNDALA